MDGKILDNGYYHLAVKIHDKKGYDSHGKLSAIQQIEDGEWKFCN